MNKKVVKASMISLATVAVLSMTGCGGSGSSSNNGSTGKAVDGYIKGARVYLDMDGDTKYDAGKGDVEVGITDAKGNYNLSGVSQDDIRYAVENGKALVVEGGIDQDSDNAFNNKIAAPFTGDATVITPLTTIAYKLYSSTDLNSSEAYTNAAKVFGLTAEDLEKDPKAVAAEGNSTLHEKIGLPLMVRPSYVLGGRAMEIVYEKSQLKNFVEEAFKAAEKNPINRTRTGDPQLGRLTL
jgi:hypothetical protein